jgi:hypothetical protein
VRKRSALTMTDMGLSDIANAATIGLRRRPVGAARLDRDRRQS